MTDLEIFPRHRLIRQDRYQKRAAAGHVVILIGNLVVLFLDRATPRRVSRIGYFDAMSTLRKT